MNRQDVCILINSTPKYFYLLPLQLTMLRRYAPKLKWPIYFATEALDNPIIPRLITEFQVKILSLTQSEEPFLESRQAALHKLPPTITYVLPLQEDFLLDREPNYKALEDALTILDMDRMVSSLRLNPCPGPNPLDTQYHKEKPWKILSERDRYIFTYQATLWRRLDLKIYYDELIRESHKFYGTASEDRKKIALVQNIGESEFGQGVLRKILPNTYHLSWPRAGTWANAVYLCPWPYRPTAVTRGNLESFAQELFMREGVKLEGSIIGMM